MKQEYRHTRPYRGKDPNFETEEITEQKIDNAIDDANSQGLICIRCAGYGGHYIEGDGYMPCYACGDSGVQSYASWQEDISCTIV